MQFVNLLKRDVIQQRKAIGFKFHVTDLYLEELCKVAGETIENDAFIQLINPFLFEFGNSTDKGWQRRMKSSLFDKMIEDVQLTLQSLNYSKNEIKRILPIIIKETDVLTGNKKIISFENLLKLAMECLDNDNSNLVR